MAAGGKRTLEIDIFEIDPQDGEGKTRNKPSTEIQRRVDKQSKTPTSLIVFHREVHGKKPDYRVSSLRIEFAFADHNSEADANTRPNPGPHASITTNNLSSPDIAARGPYIFRAYRYSTEDVSKNEEAEGETGGGLDGAKLGMKLKMAKEKAYVQSHFESVESAWDFNDEERRHDRVWWTFWRNESQKHGIVPGFRVAVLIKRKNDMPFKGILKEIRLGGGWKYPAMRSWENFTGASRPNIDDHVNFDPKAEPLGLDSYDRTALGELATGEAIGTDIAWIWGIDVHEN